MKEGRVNAEARALFWQARDQARLELPEDIQKYTQDIFDKMLEAFVPVTHEIAPNDKGGQPQGDKRKAVTERESEIIKNLISEQPHEIFAKYLRVKT